MNYITITGNLGRPAETRTTKNGNAVTTLALAHTPREKRDGEWVDGETMWFKVTVWADLPEALYTKGQRVIVTGELGQETYEKDGEKRVSMIIKAATVGIQHVVKDTSPANDPWSNQPAQTEWANPVNESAPF